MSNKDRYTPEQVEALHNLQKAFAAASDAGLDSITESAYSDVCTPIGSPFLCKNENGDAVVVFAQYDSQTTGLANDDDTDCAYEGIYE